MIKHLNIVYDQNSNFKEGIVTFSDLNQIVNGSVQNISCTCLDKIAYKERRIRFIDLVSKICMDGSLSLKFLNLDLLANKIKKNEINGEKFSEIISNINSIWDHAECTEFLSSLNKTVVIENLGFDDKHTIAQLKKI